MQQEKYDQSIDHSNAAKEIAVSNHYLLWQEKIEGNLGFAYFQMGDFERALTSYNDAERHAKELGANIDESRWLNNLGMVYARLNQSDLAEKYYRQSLKLAEERNDGEQSIIALTNLAFLLADTPKLDEAATFSARAISLAHTYSDHSAELYPTLAKGMVAERSGDASGADVIFAELAKDPDSDSPLRWEAQRLLARSLEGNGRTVEAAAQYRTALNTVQSARQTLQHEEFRLPFQTNAEPLYDDYIHLLVGQGKKMEALSAADESRALTLAEGLGLSQRAQRQGAHKFDPQASARRERATILFYSLSPEHSYLWAINGKETRLIELPPTAGIESLVGKYKKALMGPREPLQNGSSDGQELYRILIAPASDMIARNSRVIVAADGALSGLNFEALPVPGPTPHYWIDDVTITNVSSLRLLEERSTKRKQSAQPTLLMIGNPVATSREFGSLPNAGLEMQKIEEQFPGGSEQVYAGEHATAQAYLTGHPEQFTYIHFVAHGTASLLTPLDSAVVLSAPSASTSLAKDGVYKLYARDIIAHPLKAELVTVSTCYGAGARAYTGEGLVGLSWAFLRAGAHNVIGALWEVSDSSTPQLMERMYAELGKGSTPDVALREAKLSLLHSGGVYRKPYYWAAFQLYAGS